MTNPPISEAVEQTLKAQCLAYHKADDGEGEYGCPGVECPGVERLMKLARPAYALGAESRQPEVEKLEADIEAFNRNDNDHTGAAIVWHELYREFRDRAEALQARLTELEQERDQAQAVADLRPKAGEEVV